MTAETSVPSSALLTGADRDGSNYTARHLLVLEGLEAVRKRPGMYIGSTDSRGLMHCVWEIIDNSVDEALGGHCDYIEVILGEDASIEVRDNGRGIPVDVEPKTGLSGVEVVMTKLHAGGKFGGGSYAASGGLHGVGASVVNALSARLDVEVDRSGHTHAISFRRGVPGSFSGAGPDAAFDPASGVKKAKKVPRTRTGTRVRYWADRQIFLKDAKLSLETLHQRARQTAFLVPGLTIVVRDERGIESDKPVEETFHFDGGISEFCEFLAPDKPICDVLRLTGSGTFKETVPVLDDRGHMTPTEVTRELGVDIALRWGTGYDTTARSFVNIIATPKGGTHVTGFERSVTRTMNEALRAAKLLRVAEDDIVKDDAMEGLTAVVTVRLAEPQFEGQTKEVLGTSAANRIVATVVAKELKEFLTSTKRDAKVQARAVLEKAVAAARTRIAARQHKEAQRRKTALETSSLLYQARRLPQRRRRAQRTVHRGGRLGARHRQTGPKLGVPGSAADPREDPQHPEVVGLRHAQERRVRRDHPGHRSLPGRTFDIDQARYGKVIFLADADVDGAHIRCLLLTLFQRYMRPMVEEGRVFSAVPPLHRIELVQPKKGQDKYIYTYSDSELRQTLLDLQRRNVRYKDGIQRYKGLGEMDANQLAETTMDPRHRTLRRINISDIEAAEQAFDLLMGNEVAPRKEFITNSATTLDRSKIDV